MEVVRVLFPWSQLYSRLCLDEVATMRPGIKALSHWQHLIPREGHGPDTTATSYGHCTHTPISPAGGFLEYGLVLHFSRLRPGQ